MVEISIGIAIEIDSNTFTMCKNKGNLYLDCISLNGLKDEEKRIEITTEDMYLHSLFDDLLTGSEDSLNDGRLILFSDGFKENEDPSALIVEYDQDKENIILSFKKGKFENNICSYNVKFENVGSLHNPRPLQLLMKIYEGLLNRDYQERQNCGTSRKMPNPHKGKA